MLIFAVAKFTEGAWVVVVLFPILSAALIRLHHIYSAEEGELEANVQNAAVAPILPRHAVLVFVERFDLAAARALQYARSLSPEEPRVDPLRARHRRGTRARTALGPARALVGLARAHRVPRSAPRSRRARARRGDGSDGETEVTVLLPRRVYNGSARWLLHDRTSERIAGLVSEIPNASATIIPFYLGTRRRAIEFPPAPERGRRSRRVVEANQTLVVLRRAAAAAVDDGARRDDADRPGARAHPRAGGRTRALGPGPARDGSFELGVHARRRHGSAPPDLPGAAPAPGIEPGARLAVEGMVGRAGAATDDDESGVYPATTTGAADARCYEWNGLAAC